ncbi:phenylalanine--tRNA ligase subunit beta [Mycoplasma procyoni]|uniref:phenylalanine--tRNA ligase subunit beta n=1 Tax=Mycoplasma procyoni TaxID=568784 RepID=UPI00197B903A|nr:phenylalanine--tRNA ligase subunit beta [Mycoplasma procyoni]MBN3534359.1 phenylalanine--tRNA ligase subunit beta [Mycoplasma procyoni]
MIFSLNKLKQLANIEKVELQSIIKAINSIGFEVEDYWKFSEVQGIKFGYVKNIYKNPNADKLNVCEIKFADQDRVIQTVATNVKQGDYLMAFVPGSTNGKMVFDKKVLQGIESEGMLVSLNELGFNPEYVWDEYKEGIFTFGEVDLNLDPVKYFSIDDYLIDIKILSNRSDANSYLVMARELAAYFLENFNDLEFTKATFESNFKIENGHGKLSGLEAKVDPSFKLCLKDSLLLTKSNIKLINPIVDLTNLTLIMTGMPVHAYDKSKINLGIKPQLFSSEFEILGKKVINFENALGIVDSKNQVVSLAGVMGGEKTGIDSNSKEVIFEIGNFPIKDVRATQKQLKLDSNAFKQSSKKISYGTMELAHKFLSNRLSDFSAPINFEQNTQKSFIFDKEFLDRLTGFNISGMGKFRKVLDSLQILGFKFQDDKVFIPSYRHDIEDMDDMLEEVMRFYSYELQGSQPALTTFKVQKRIDTKEIISGCGFQEVWTYTLISKEKNVFNPFDFKNNISLQTFVSKEREEIRNSLAISLAEVIEYNQKRKMEDINIFEIGTVNEYKNVLALASTTKSFNDLKQVLINNVSSKLVFKRATEQQFHPGVSAKIFYNDTLVGWIGKISPYLNVSDAYFAEINLDAFESKVAVFEQYNSDPLKSRDITFSLGLKDSLEQTINELKELTENKHFSIKIKDIFVKDDLKKVTLNIICDDEVMKKIDQKYNN